jgi:4-amino-4-deoxy-L-arabinose transferase-like glycosyltransferase
LIGWGLKIQNRQPITTDWNWSGTWEENRESGALPSADVLLAARWSVAWLFPFTCLFLFLTVRKLDGIVSAGLAVLLLSFNALVLLHTRRAMAESALLCLFSASICALICLDRRTWLAAIPTALALNAKQTAVTLAGIGFLNIFLIPGEKIGRKRIFSASLFLAILFVMTWILNPVFWKYPLAAISEGMVQRSNLSPRMQSDYLNTYNPLEQTAILIAQVFIQPPASADVLNYQAATKPQEDYYFAQPQNNLFRGFAGGAILFGLTLVGFIIMIRRLVSTKTAERYPLALFLTITLVSIAVITFFTPVPFQRYYLILVPLFIVPQAAAITALGKGAFQLIKQKKAA